MAKTAYRILKLEKEHGDLEKVIPHMVNAIGQAQTAERLGVAQATISRWLKDNGYISRIVYQKSEERNDTIQPGQ